MKSYLIFATLLTTLGTSAPALAHNGLRVFLTVENDQLLTNLDNFQNAHNLTPNVRVFHGAFGQDPENPLANFTQFPGLSGSVTPGTALTAFTSIDFNILDAVKYWDGTGDVAFGPSPETITISRGTNQATSSTGFVSGFTLVASVSPNDGWHTHPGYTLNPDSLGQRHDGVYLLQLSMSNNNLTTQPFWVVFGQNRDDTVIARAVDSVNATAVPEPASLSILSAGLLLLMRRRK